jgi:galactokinase
MQVEISQAFEAEFGARPDFLVRAPGRVDVIGTHTDYNDGWVLPAAIDHFVHLAVRRHDEPSVTIRALDMNEKVTFSLTDLEAQKAEIPSWATYPAGVAWSLQNAGFSTPGCQVTLESKVPIGAGLSSSAAVEVAYAMAWKQMGGWEASRMTLAQLCQKAENQYVGVNSGLMDQFASLHGQKGKALLLDCRTLDWEATPLPSDVILVVVDTATRRSLTTSHYNERRADCEAAVEALRPHIPDIKALRDVSPEQFEQLKMEIPEQPRMRAAHIINENRRVREAAEALRGGDVIRLGQLMDESQISSRDLFEASGPELDAMWKVAHGHPARLGGRFSGAGWAGCMVFLVSAEGSEDFNSFLSMGYKQVTGLDATMYPMRAADGATVIEEP